MITPILKPKKETKAEKLARKKAKHKLTKGFYNQQVKKLEKECDKLWSLKVREKCRCELCGRTGDIKGFDAHHLIGRGHKATRWDLNNGACLCKGDHRFKVHQDTFTAAILFEKLKDKRGYSWFDNLYILKNQIFNPTRAYLEDIIKSLS